MNIEDPVPPFPIDRDALLHDARILLKGMPKRVRGHEGECEGNVCIETHLIGHNKGEPGFGGQDALEGDRFTIFADYDIHGRKYVHVWAEFPRMFMPSHRVNLDEVLCEAAR